MVIGWIQNSVRAVNRQAWIEWIEGNHENWVEQYVDANPQLTGMLEVESQCHVAERGIHYVPFWRDNKNTVKIGKATFVHGQYTNKYHAAKMVDAYGCNVYYGHTHDVMEYPKTNVGDGN